MIKNILMVDREPFSPRREKIFCIKELRDAGFNFHHFYISPIFREEYNVPDRITNEIAHDCNTTDELENLIAIYDRNVSTIIMEFPLCDYKFREIYAIASNSGMLLLKIERFGNTILLSKPYFTETIRKFFIPSKIISGLKNKIFYKIYRKIKQIRPIDYYFNSGFNNYADVKINHPDYDDFLNLENTLASILPSNSYITFIDTYFGCHPDEIASYGHSLGDNELWRKKLCMFFDAIEDLYKKKVVIAAHPKSDYSYNAWGNRRIIKNQTLNLIYNADFVIQDISTSIGYALMSQKNVMQVSTKEFYKAHKTYINRLSQFIKIPIVFAERFSSDDLKVKNFNKKIRDNYIYGYLTSKETENRLSSEILLKWFKNFGGHFD